MSLLYSQNSRNLLLSNENLLNKRRDKISKILHQILTRQIIKNKYEEDYFKFMTSEKILKYFNVFPIKEKYLSILKNGYDSSFEIHKCIEKFGKTSLDLIVYDNKIYSDFKFIIDEIKILFEIILEIKINNEIGKKERDERKIEIIRKIILKIRSYTIDIFSYNPDYIIVHPILQQQLNNNKSPYDFIILTIINILQKNNLIDKVLLNNYGISNNGILELNNEITYNNETYILDSCILGNYNIVGNMGHAITGITCNNNRYIYNGTFIKEKSFEDPKIIKRKKCDLIRYSWNVNDPTDFCLNPFVCKTYSVIPQIQNKVLCFSFDKGPRTLVYINKTRLTKTIPDIYKNTSNTLSNFELPSFEDISKSEEKANMQKFMDELQIEIDNLQLKKRRK
jgi:hypothetical protein